MKFTAPMMKNRKITPLFVVLPIAIFISVFYSLYYLFVEMRGDMKQAGFLLLSLSVGLIAVLVLERIFVTKLSSHLKSIWIVELLLILSLAVFYKYKHATFYYTVSDDTKWFATFLEKTASKKSHYSFPFNKEISIDSNQVLSISKDDIGRKREAIRSSGHKWRGYSWQCREVTVSGRKINLNIFSRPRTELTYTDYKKMEFLLLRELHP